MSQSSSKQNKFIASVYEWVEVFCFALFVVVMLFTFVCRLITVDGPSMNNTLKHGDRLVISNLFYTPDTGDIVVLQDSTSTIMSAPIIKRVIATEGETVDINPETWEVTVTDKDGNVRVLQEDYARKVYKVSIRISGNETVELDLDTNNAVVKDSSGRITAGASEVEVVDENNLTIYVDGKYIDVNTETLEATVTDSMGFEKKIDKDRVKKNLANMRTASVGETYVYPGAIPPGGYPHTVKEGHVFVMGDNRNNSLDSRLIGDVDERMIIGKAYVRVFPNPKIGF